MPIPSMIRTSIRLLLLIQIAARADLLVKPLHTVAGLSCPYNLELADFDGDGRTDLAVSSWRRVAGRREEYDPTEHRVLIFLQKDGRFPAAPDREIKIAFPWALHAGDFDGDGRTDLAVKESRRRLHLFLGSEDFRRDHVSSDINDSCRTVVSGRLGPGGLCDFLSGPVWRKWRGADRFTCGYCYGPQKNDNRDAVVADLDGDGHNDIVFIADRCIRLYYGPFLRKAVHPADLSHFVEIRTQGRPVRAAVADLNADGRPDLAVGLRDPEHGERSVALFLQRAPLGFPTPMTPAVRITGVEGPLLVPDLNRDGLADLVVADSESRRICVFLQHKGRITARNAAADQVLRVRGYDVKAADVDGDGFPDLAVSDGRSRVWIFRNTGAPWSGRQRPLDGVRSVQLQPAGTVSSKHAAPRSVPIRSGAPRSPQDAVRETKKLLGNLPPPAKDRAFASLNHMPYYTGSILPTPRHAVYGTETFPLMDAAVLPGDGIAPDGPYVRELRTRIEGCGGRLKIAASAATACDTLVLLGPGRRAERFLKHHPVPHHPQGYVMTTAVWNSKNVVALAGRDRQGLLWAISSFSQLVHNVGGVCRVRRAEVTDWPYALNRGFIAGRWPDAAPYCIAFKINKPVFQSGLVDYSILDRKKRAEAWRRPLSSTVLRELEHLGERLSPFGIRWYVGQNPIACNKKIRSGNDEDFNRVLSWARAAAREGGNLCLKYDDHRFPVSPEDKEQFGTAREADIHLLKRLHAELKKRRIECRILFCPPFYWGPASPAPYPEPRDDYLFAIGKRLPGDIGIFWTGPRVKSGRVTREMVAWITERIGRKPVYWQNAFGMPHMFTYHYVTDPIPAFKEWFYDGFLHDVDAYLLNCMMPSYAAAAAACADFCWNPRAYDPARSIAEAAAKLVGPDTVPVLEALNRALSYFDRFGLRRTPAAARLLPVMQQKLAVVNAVWQEVERRNVAAVRKWTGMERHVQQVNHFVRNLLKDPNLAAYRQDAGESRERARKEAGFTPGRDVFLSAYDFVGGCGPAKYGLRCEKRTATWIYGRRSSNPSMEGLFRIDPFPPSTDYELTVSAQDDESEHHCRIRILVNDTVVFEGPNPFARNGWSRHTFPIPARALNRRNRLRFENIEDPRCSSGPPFFMLNYAIVRKVR